jgi:hypothetical protein
LRWEKRGVPLRRDNAEQAAIRRDRSQCRAFAVEKEKKKKSKHSLQRAHLSCFRDRGALSSRRGIKVQIPNARIEPSSKWRRSIIVLFETSVERENTPISFPLGIRRIYG